MFYEKFLDLCKKQGISPSRVAKDLSFGNSIAVQWKKGAVPRNSTILMLAEYFGVDPGYFSESGETAPPAGVRIPIFGNVAAGIPIEAITDIEDYEEIPAEMARGGEYVALRIHGRSMEPRMLDGDVVIVRLQDDVDSGDIAIVFVNGCDATCKQVIKTADGLSLVSINPEYKPMPFTRQQVQDFPVRIWGKVVELRAKF